MTTTSTEQHPTTTKMGTKKNIVDTAIAAGNFKTLAKALEAANLIGTLEGEGPFTVLAPTDAAFAKLPAGALDKLLGKPDQLKNVLMLHVVQGRLSADKLSKLHEVKNLAGTKLPVHAAKGGVEVGGAKVSRADLEASNGIIHVIDTVLMPAK